MAQRWALNRSGISLESRRSHNKTVKAAGFFLPALAMLLLFYIGPMVMTLFFSFTNMAMTGVHAKHVQFIGFGNFARVFSDPKFGSAIRNTLVFLVCSGILGQQVCGFLFALLMKKKHKALRRFVGMVVTVGWITPEIIAAFIFAAFFAKNGTLNVILGLGGIKPISWLFAFPMVSVIIANIWKGTAYAMLMFQAALDSISDEVEEASMIDGASRPQILRYITIPMIKSTFAVTFVNVTLGTLGSFVLIYTLTGGGPAGATTTLSIFMYEQAFLAYQIGYGMAIALILLLIGVVFSLFYLRALNMRD